jgi:hypothetical protein
MIMTDFLPNWIDGLMTSEQQLTVGLLILAALVALAYLLRTPLRSWQEQRQIRHAVKRIGARVMRDVNLPDGIGGVITIDYLVLSSDAILVIGVKRYDGIIFGSANTDEWTQTLNSRSYRFPNPDIYLAQQLSAVRTIAPKVPVKGLHLFTDTATFPWDKPDNVLQVKDLLSRNIEHPGLKGIPADLGTAWKQLSKSRRR